MSTLVKICGITKRETLTAIRHLPIDYIGFVFAASKRQVNQEQAAELQRELLSGSPDRRPRTVGVFVNPALAELERILHMASLDVVQLHGQESPEFCRQVKERFGVQVFKVLPVEMEVQSLEHDGGEDNSLYRMPDEYAGVIDALMLDTFDARAAGGTGKTFRWSVIPKYREWAVRAGIPLIVAGGLHLDNVAELIAEYQPHGVDVSSGVETDGQKDISKITTFVERVKQHGASMA